MCACRTGATDRTGYKPCPSLAPSTPVVPVADLLAVQARQLRSKHCVEITLVVPADGRVALIQRNVIEIVQAGEEAHLGELAHSREKAEANMAVARLDDRIQPAQVVALGPGQLGLFKASRMGLSYLSTSTTTRGQV